MYFSWFPITIIAIWIISGICSMVTKKTDYISIAAQITVVMGLGYLLLKIH